MNNEVTDIQGVSGGIVNILYFGENGVTGIQGVSRGIVNILGGHSMDYSQ